VGAPYAGRVHQPSETAPGPRPGRRPRLLLVGVAVVVGAALVGLAAAAPSVVRAVGWYAPGPTLDAVRTWERLPRRHTDGDVTYPQVPPAGGPHADEWLECGVYDVPVRDENAVHDLEHGTVWITYDPDLPASEVGLLVAELPDNGILSPYPGLPAPVVVTVWGAQLRLSGAADPRLPLFVRTYGGGRTAPEPDASCRGGTADPGGGTGVPV
jgi:hypothetical protein